MYTLTRQLYFGSCEVIKAARLWDNPPSKYTEVLGHLSTMPQWIHLLKRSACRAGVMRGLALAKAYYPQLNPAPLKKGFPQFDTDGKEFDKKCYARVVKQTRHVATVIASKMKLTTLQLGYTENDEEIMDDEPQRVDLLQSYKDSIDPAKNAPGTSTAPSSSTPVIPPPSRAIAEEDDENFFQPLRKITRRKTKAKETDEIKEPEANPAAAEEEDPAKTVEDQPTGSPPRDPAPEAKA